VVDSEGRTIWIADAHRGDRKRFVACGRKADAFVQLKSAIFPNASDHSLKISRTAWRVLCEIPALEDGSTFYAGAKNGVAGEMSQLGEKEMKTRNTASSLIALLLAWFALLPVAQAGNNTAYGDGVLTNVTTGENNSGFGWAALFSNTSGAQNTAIGAGALVVNTTGTSNTAVGTAALLFNTSSNNTAIGAGALSSNTSGPVNTAVGVSALNSNTEGGGNTAVGNSALGGSTTGHDNTAIGTGTLPNNTSGSRNTAVGNAAGFFVGTADDVICIGAAGQNVSNSCYIGNIFGETSASGIPVIVNSNNKLGTTTSSKRFKENIKPMNKASETLYALAPVTFQYKKEIDPARTSQFGLVAEEVEKVSPDLVMRDADGAVYTVRYDMVNAMLLNEFLKEHRKNEEQGATITQLKSMVEKQEAANAQQQKQIEALTTGLQKVNAQLEASKPVPQMVNNP
jgi:hypothetical protein